jgi:hypothetical protein
VKANLLRDEGEICYEVVRGKMDASSDNDLRLSLLPSNTGEKGERGTDPSSPEHDQDGPGNQNAARRRWQH